MRDHVCPSCTRFLVAFYTEDALAWHDFAKHNGPYPLTLPPKRRPTPGSGASGGRPRRKDERDGRVAESVLERQETPEKEWDPEDWR